MNAVAHIDVQGLENFPRQGAFIYVMNHLSAFDMFINFSIMPIRRSSFLGAVEHRSNFLFGWMADRLGVIWIRRNEIDRQAIRIALDEIKEGTGVGVAIEGTRSRTGGLQKGKPGAAYLATRAKVPIVPGVIWNSDKIKHNLRRLKRTRVHVRIGPAFRLPEQRAGSAELKEYTDQIMLKLASMLPAEYRGEYAERVTK